MEAGTMKQEFHLILGIDDFAGALADALFQVGFDHSHLAKQRKQSSIIVDDRDTTDIAATDLAAVAENRKRGQVGQDSLI
jgi:hypothetical protein